MFSHWKDRVAVVTGASSGIGRAIAIALGHEGSTVCLVGRDRGALEVTAARSGASAAPFPADLEHDVEIAALAGRIRREVDRVDVLVHAAGVLLPSATADADVKDLDAQYRVNVRAPWALTQGLLPMLRATSGQIVFLNATVDGAAAQGLGQYAASKHALRGIADALREELGADGVRVLSVAVGPTATPLRQTLHARDGRAWRPERLIQPEDVARVVVHALTLPRTVEMTDVTLRPSRLTA
jgi:NADP-dependent 3-hydroxy acid dehydrogenase YdfG